MSSELRQTIDTPSACPLCGGSELIPYHDQVWRRLIKCRTCRIVVADPLPSLDEKIEIERQAYVGEALPETAEFFANCNRDFEEDAVIRSFRRIISQMGEAREPGRLLDVGPGTGIFLHLAREQGWEPHGIDVCEIAAAKARDEFGIDIDVGEFGQFPYEPASFDCITMLDVLEHTLDPVGFLERALDLLKPGGILVVAVPNQQCLLTAILDRYIWLAGFGGQWFLERLYVSPHVYYFGPRVLKFALERARFSIVRLEGGNVYLGRYRLPIWMRVPLELVLHVGSLLGMSARVIAIARKPGAE